jgi:hypothetical protein
MFSASIRLPLRPLADECKLFRVRLAYKPVPMKWRVVRVLAAHLRFDDVAARAKIKADPLSK